jgi:dCTP deaminase
MTLPDWHIAQSLLSGEIGIDNTPMSLSGQPLEENARQLVEDSEFLQPSSLDVRLSDEFVVFDDDHDRGAIDPSEDLEDYGREIVKPDGLYINPGEFMLGKTIEWFRLPDDIKAELKGRSSWGRLAIVPHIEAGYIDNGYEGNITLEITNLGRHPVKLNPGVRFCQMVFERLDAPAHQGYNGKYQGDKTAEQSRISEDF